MVRYLCLVLLFLLCAGIGHAQPVVRISGSTTVSGFIAMEKKADVEQETGARIFLYVNGSGLGFQSLLDGKSDIAMSSADPLLLKDKYNVNDRVFRNIEVHKLGESRVALAIHPSNPVEELSHKKVKDILTGKITNWKQVGGKDIPVRIILEPMSNGIRSTAKELVLEGDSFNGTISTVPTAFRIVDIVSRVEGAIGVTSLALYNSKIKELKVTGKKFGQPLLMITTKDASEATKNVIKTYQKMVSEKYDQENF